MWRVVRTRGEESWVETSRAGLVVKLSPNLTSGSVDRMYPDKLLREEFCVFLASVRREETELFDAQNFFSRNLARPA